MRAVQRLKPTHRLPPPLRQPASKDDREQYYTDLARKVLFEQFAEYFQKGWLEEATFGRSVVNLVPETPTAKVYSILREMTEARRQVDYYGQIESFWQRLKAA